MRCLLVAIAWLGIAGVSPAQIVEQVVFRVGDNASLDWFVIDNPSIRGTLQVTNAPYASTVSLNGAAVDAGRNRLVFAAPSGTGTPAPFNGYAINLTGLQLTANAATPVTVTNLGAWDTGVDNAGYRKADGQIYYAPFGTDQVRTLNFGPTGLIIGFTNVGNYNGSVSPNSVTQGDIDFSADGSMWVAGNNADTTPVVPTLWHFSVPTLNALAAVLTGNEVYNGITFNAAGDTLYGYKQSTGQYGTINTATGGFQTVLATDTVEFGVFGDLATGTAIVVTVPEPGTVGLLGAAAVGGLVRWLRRRK